jgi:hypothetical protein
MIKEPIRGMGLEWAGRAIGRKKLRPPVQILKHAPLFRIGEGPRSVLYNN